MDWKEVNATRVIVAILGVIFAIGALDHGFLEAIQGYKPTGGLLINALAPGYSWSIWKEGGEGAFTIVPNFLITGVLSMIAGLTGAIWSIKFMDRNHAALILLLIFVFTFLVGGGIAQVLFFIITWGVATRINKPLNFWRFVLPRSTRKVLSKLWLVSMITWTILFLCALEMAIIGYIPWVRDQLKVLHTCWTFLLIGLGCLTLGIISGFAHDIERQDAINH